MKLSPQEIRILSTINRIGYAPIQALADDSGLKPHTVRYALQGMLERKLIEPFCGVNVQALGFKHFTTYFSFKAESQEHEELVVNIAAKHQNVSWVAAFSGEYQFGIQVLAPSQTEALRIFGEIRAAMSVTWYRKAFIQSSAIYIWPLKYFSEDGLPGTSQYYCPVPQVHEMDALDHKILKIRTEDPLSADSRVARSCGVPDNTVTYRIKKLQSAGVITGYGFRANWELLGISQFKVVVSLKVLDLGVHEALLSFAKRMVSCSLALPCLGAWDFEFNIFALSADEARSFSNHLVRHFGDVIDTVQVISFPRTIKQVAYPFIDELAAIITPAQRARLAVGE